MTHPAVDPPSMRCVQRRRDTDECMDLLDLVRSNPGQWFLFSTHSSQSAAYNYAYNLMTDGHQALRQEFVPYRTHLRFARLDYDAERGPAVGICWVP